MLVHSQVLFVSPIQSVTTVKGTTHKFSVTAVVDPDNMRAPSIDATFSSQNVEDVNKFHKLYNSHIGKSPVLMPIRLNLFNNSLGYYIEPRAPHLYAQPKQV